MLKKSTSLILSVVVLTQSVNIHLSDIFGLHDLIEHIEFHQATYGDNLFSFLAKHYGDEMQEHEGETGGDREHQKLPFNHHRASLDTGCIFVFFQDQPTFLGSNSPTAKKTDFYYYNFYSFLENTDIFQPPRHA